MIQDIQNKITILGYSAINLPLIMELAFETSNYNQFDIYPNLDEYLPPVIIKKLPFYNFKWKDYNRVSNELELTNNILGVTNPIAKSKVYEFFEKYEALKKTYVNIIHPTSYISQSAALNTGIIVEPMVSVSSQTKIGFGTTIKRSSTIGHHNKIKDFVSINPGVVISGNVEIGEGTTIGSGAVVRDRIEIGSNSIIGAGSVVTKNIPSNVIAFGNPCRVVKENTQ